MILDFRASITGKCSLCKAIKKVENLIILLINNMRVIGREGGKVPYNLNVVANGLK